MRGGENYMTVKLHDLEFHVKTAASFGTRFKGLMGEKELPKGEGLLLENCGSIHCCFMKFPIDVVYLDRDRRVVGKETVKPWRVGKIIPGVHSVLELNEGEASAVETGDEMLIEM